MARTRRSYDARTGRDSRSASILAAAFCAKPEPRVYDLDGNWLRVWKKDELQRWTHDQVASALGGKRAFERVELNETIPPTAVKHALTKGWLWADASDLLWVTEAGATELKLPRKVGGVTIRFLKKAA
jgi:hypothetical protein